MTRLELLRIVIGRARSNGFEFRRWYVVRLGEPWINAELSLSNLEQHRRYYALLFSHEFACTFWKPGEEISFQVEGKTFQQILPNGKVTTVTRKPFTRRSTRRDAWRFHLRQMALAEEPLRYIRRYLHVEEAPYTADTHTAPATSAKTKPARKTPAGAVAPASAVDPGAATRAIAVAPSMAAKMKTGSRRGTIRPLPPGPPAFLLRPYGGRARDSDSA